MKIAEWHAHSPHADRRPGSWSMGWRWKLAVAVWAMAFWGVRPLWDPDPARYAEAARETLMDGRWLVPALNGADHLTKPPFVYWITALGMKIFGVNAWGAQFFLSLAFMGAIFCVIDLARTWGWRRPRALMAGMVFATSLLSFACGNVLSTDMFLLFWETLGMLAAWKVWRGEAGFAQWRVVFWFAFGMAFLTKGPPAWLPLLVICVYHFAWPRRQKLRGLGLAWGVPLMLAIAFSWYAAVAAVRPGTLEYWLGYEVRDRIFSEAQGRHEFILFYFYVIPLGCGPWLVLWPELMRRTWRKIRQDWRFLRDEEAFALIWVALPLIIFTFSGSKMFLYVAPLMVPLSLYLGKITDEARERLPQMAPRVRLAVCVAASAWLTGLQVFRVLPASLTPSRTRIALAREVPKSGVLEGVELYTARDDSPLYSFNFYSGIIARRATENLDEMPEFLFARELAGRPCAALVSIKNYKDLLEDARPGVQCDTLAHDDAVMIVRFNPAHIPRLKPDAVSDPGPATPDTLDLYPPLASH